MKDKGAPKAARCPDSAPDLRESQELEKRNVTVEKPFFTNTRPNDLKIIIVE